jgi:hypothetical protein
LGCRIPTANLPSFLKLSTSAGFDQNSRSRENLELRI